MATQVCRVGEWGLGKRRFVNDHDAPLIHNVDRSVTVFNDSVLADRQAGVFGRNCVNVCALRLRIVSKDGCGCD